MIESGCQRQDLEVPQRYIRWPLALSDGTDTELLAGGLTQMEIASRTGTPRGRIDGSGGGVASVGPGLRRRCR